MYQAETLTSWATIAVFLLAAAGRTAGQVVDPAVRAQVVTECQQQVSLQQTALIAQLAPNQAFGGVISQAFQTLQAMTSFGVTLHTAQDMPTFIQALTEFEEQVSILSTGIQCRNAVPGCVTCLPGFIGCQVCLPPFIPAPGGLTCLPGGLPGFPASLPTPGSYGGPQSPQASFIAAEQFQEEVQQQTSIAAQFPIG